MDLFELADVRMDLKETERRSVEFLRSDTMSVLLFELPAGAEDTQRPHTEDEIYHIISGRGAIRVGGEDSPVQPGTTVFVGANVEHRFHSIAEDLSILVVFAPPRGSLA